MLGNNIIPDLRYSTYTANAEAWKAVVVDGQPADRGMVSFAVNVSPGQAELIRACIVSQAHQ